jgi:tRNA(Ile2) C34 agmatinyltransferase TiaS
MLKKWQLENPEEYKRIQKESAILGGKIMGKIQGQRNKESGHISNLGKKMTEHNNRLQKCPYCGIETRGAGYVRWHGEKCKLKL